MADSHAFVLSAKMLCILGHLLEDDGKWQLHHGDTILLSLSKAVSGVDSNGNLGSGKSLKTYENV